MRRCPRSPGVCCELCSPLYEVFCSSRDILGQHSPRAAAARRPSSPCTAYHRARQRRAGCRTTGPGKGGTKPQGTGAPRAGGHGSAPKPSMGRRWGASSPRPWVWRLEQPRTHEPGGTRTGACLALAEGLQVGHTAPEKPSYGMTEGEGQPGPESWHSRPGCRHRPLANAFHAARLGKRGGATAESPPAPAGKSASPAAAGSFLLISSQPACGLPAPASAEHPSPPIPLLPGPSWQGANASLPPSPAFSSCKASR